MNIDFVSVVFYRGDTAEHISVQEHLPALAEEQKPAPIIESEQMPRGIVDNRLGH